MDIPEEIDSLDDICDKLPSRRERIATACLAGFCASPSMAGSVEEQSRWAVRYADGLIAELDKETP